MLSLRAEISRGFGFLRFPTHERSKAFLEQNYPTILFHEKTVEGDDQTAEVRVAFSRERDDPNRGSGQESEWICRIV